MTWGVRECFGYCSCHGLTNSNNDCKGSTRTFAFGLRISPTNASISENTVAVQFTAGSIMQQLKVELYSLMRSLTFCHLLVHKSIFSIKAELLMPVAFPGTFCSSRTCLINPHCLFEFKLSNLFWMWPTTNHRVWSHPPINYSNG